MSARKGEAERSTSSADLILSAPMRPAARIFRGRGAVAVPGSMATDFRVKAGADLIHSLILTF